MRPHLCLATSLLLPAPVLAQWSTPTVVPNVNRGNSTEDDPVPTFDGLSLYFSSSRTGYGYFAIFRSTRATPYSAFGVPVQLTELTSTGTDDGGPGPRIDDLELFFYSSRVGGGGGGIDIWRATRASTGVPFNAPTPVTELNTARNELTCHISADGLRIWFSSNRAGSPYRLDIWVASRLDLASPFGNITNVTALNSTGMARGPGAAVFDDEIFFSSVGGNAYDIVSSRFTGITSVGIATPGWGMDLRFSDPSSPGGLYLAISSLGSSPGIPIDTRILPLNFDVLFRVTLGGLPPILTGYTGVLDRDGVAQARIDVTGFPQLRGLRFFTAFVVIDLTAPSGIKTISNAHEVLVQ